MNILCYGASNTYGFDPRTYTGKPYNSVWTDILGRRLNIPVVNAGCPGKKIPSTDAQIQNAVNSIESLTGDESLVIVMLGTNDLLSGKSPKECIYAMRKFLNRCNKKVFLIGPPPIRGLENEVKELNSGLSKLGLPFTDASKWPLELSFDGIHLSEKDQYTFADYLIKAFF